MGWLQNFTNALMKSPAGIPILTTLASAALEGNVRPWLQNHGSDVAVTATPDMKSVQVDFANRSMGQATLLWRAPQPVLANPTQLQPLDQLWANVQAVQQLNNAANGNGNP